MYFAWYVECLNFRPGQKITDDDYGPYSEPWGAEVFDLDSHSPAVGEGLVLGASRFGLSEVWKIVRVLKSSCMVECVRASDFQGYGAYE